MVWNQGISFQSLEHHMLMALYIVIEQTQMNAPWSRMLRMFKLGDE